MSLETIESIISLRIIYIASYEIGGLKMKKLKIKEFIKSHKKDIIIGGLIITNVGLMALARSHHSTTRFYLVEDQEAKIDWNEIIKNIDWNEKPTFFTRFETITKDKFE